MLYQPCPICRVEPVCVDCERCQTHCTYPATQQANELARRAAHLGEINTGLALINSYIKEFGEPCQTVDGEIVHDSRTYHVGAGYGPGSVTRQDADGTIYLTIHTGSKVSEWAERHLSMPGTEDCFNGCNSDLIAAIRQLADGKPLSQEQTRDFTP